MNIVDGTEQVALPRSKVKVKTTFISQSSLMFISETCCNNVREAGMGLFIQAQYFAIAWSRQSGMNIEYIKTSVLIVCNAGTEVMITMLGFAEIIFHYCSDHSHIGRNSACNKARKIIK